MVQTGLPFTPEVEERTRPLFEKLNRFIPKVEWPLVAPIIDEINRLKVERNAVILAHNYMTPDIFHGVADIVGDSLALAREAVNTTADVIVLCGVHFMAETAKILNPQKTVLIADLEAGCSLAESITAEDVRQLRRLHPGVPIVTYVNTSAEVKAESDICCTSGNALAIVESLPGDKVLMIPDKYLAANIAKLTTKEVLTWEKGSCMVHDQFSPREIQALRLVYPGVKVMAHPECPTPVVEEADYSGSTAQMIDYVQREQPQQVMLVTECSMSDNVAVQFPQVNFIRPCNLCPHMKRITLPKILKCLETMGPQVEVDPLVVAKARQAIDRMLAVKNR